MKNLISSLKQRLVTGWTFQRFLRLALSLIITTEALKSGEMLFAALGGFLLLQVAFNYGCCDYGGCDVRQPGRQPKSLDAKKEATTFEEVK
jgi:hypothetical protein